MRSFRELVGQLDLGSSGLDAVIGGITADSRRVTPGDIYVCMPSVTTRTEDFIPLAVKGGAAAIVTCTEEGAAIAKSLGVAYARFHDGDLYNHDLNVLCRKLFAKEIEGVRFCAVTGTNGKTTVAWLLNQALNVLGRKSVYVGTLGVQQDGVLTELNNTTPFPVELWSVLANAGKSGATDIVMEVSSHALAQHRVSEIPFQVAGFTNLSQDHLDYHVTMEAYGKAKGQLFLELGPQQGERFCAVLNADEPCAAPWIAELMERGVRVLSFGASKGDMSLIASGSTVSKTWLKLKHHDKEFEISAPIGGAFNVQNLMVVTGMLWGLGYGVPEITEAISQLRAVPGRFELVTSPQGTQVVVDYAHTPDALEKFIQSVRVLNPKRVIVVFGCGGDRDTTKRPLMARVATEGADLTIFTSDNPRTEDPEAILDMVEVGAMPGAPYRRITDRRQAIQYALSQAQEGDLVIIAGKGHETYQIIGREKQPFDDREVVKMELPCA